MKKDHEHNFKEVKRIGYMVKQLCSACGNIRILRKKDVEEDRGSRE